MSSMDMDGLQLGLSSLTAAVAAQAPTITSISTLATTPTYANDAAAAVGGVAVGQLYRNGSIIMVRVA